MKDFENLAGKRAPWVEASSRPTSVVIAFGVTSIGKNAFRNSASVSNLTGVSIPSTVESIGSYAFYNCSAMIPCDKRSGREFDEQVA